ncbi:MAG: hypothetical protein FDZ75_03675, partial [Actinobacteria bacterium]
MSADDTGSQVAQILYSTDGGTPGTPYGSGIPIATEGTTTIKYKAVDSVGNASAVMSTTVRLDDTAPSSSDDATTTWATTSTVVHLSSGDTLSGIAGIRYTLDGSEEATYGTGITVGTEGTHTITYRGVDVAGNVESPKVATVRVDMTAPSSSTNATATYNNTATINISATDTVSGLARREYRLNGSQWTSGSVVSVSGAGTYVLDYRAVDTAGNTESYKTATLDVRSRVQQTDSKISWGGSWSTASYSGYSGGDLKTARGVGAGYTITFNGTYIDLIALTGPGYGKAKVILDGTTSQTVDFYSTNWTNQVPVWGNHALSAGNHTIRVEWTGSKNASATGDTINLDAIDVNGPLAQAPEHLTRFEETDSMITFSSTAWSTAPGTNYSGGSLKKAKGTGTGYQVNFTGTGIDLIALKGPDYGIARVIIDGTTETADFYASGFLNKQVVWGKRGLTYGPHTVRVEWTGSQNASSTNSQIDLDAVDVNGAVTQAPIWPFRIEQTDSKISWGGSWSTASYS